MPLTPAGTDSQDTDSSGNFPRRQSLILCLLLAIVTLLVYSRSLSADFTNFDDPDYVTTNSHVQAGIGWPTVQWAFTTYDAANWHPLTWLSHALDWQIFGLRPAGHHGVNLILHALNTVLLFLLLSSVTRRMWPSWAVAALWAIHPVNVESVAWVAERKNVLSMLFFLLALHAYSKFVARESIARYGVVVLLFALGLMAKPQIITFPFVLILWDYWPLHRLNLRSWWWLIAEKIPLMLLSAASAYLTVQAQSFSGAVRTIGEFSLLSRLENALTSSVRYLEIAFWPAGLSPIYPHPEGSIPGWQAAAAGAFLLLVTVVMIWQRERRYLIIGWLWFLGTSVPTIGLIQVGQQAMADRYAYLPFIGVFVATVWIITEFAERLHISSTVKTSALALTLLAMGAATYRQLYYWRDSETLWTRALSVTKKNYTAHSNLANTLAAEGRSDAAIVHFEAADRLHPYPLPQVLALGVYEQEHGHPDDAIAKFRKAAQSSEPLVSASALANLGSAYLQKGQRDSARKSYSEALQLDPKDPLALTGNGVIVFDGDPQLAVTMFSGAVAAQITDVRLLLLAAALDKTGHTEEARKAYQRAQRVSRNFARAEISANQLLGQPKVSN
jgi:tetratricopeptide (TPR) repeat protein